MREALLLCLMAAELMNINFAQKKMHKKCSVSKKEISRSLPPCRHQTITLERDLSEVYSLLHHVMSKATHVQQLHRLSMHTHTHTHLHTHTHTTNLPSTGPHSQKKRGVSVTVGRMDSAVSDARGAVYQNANLK